MLHIDSDKNETGSEWYRISHSLVTPPRRQIRIQGKLKILQNDEFEEEKPNPENCCQALNNILEVVGHRMKMIRTEMKYNANSNYQGVQHSQRVDPNIIIINWCYKSQFTLWTCSRVACVFANVLVNKSINTFNSIHPYWSSK